MSSFGAVPAPRGVAIASSQRHLARSVLLAVSLIAAACAPTASAPTPPAAAASATPRAGGTLVVANNTPPTSPLDMRTAAQASAYGVGMQIYESLYREKLGGGVEPGLAEKTEVSSDGLTWTLTLRAGAKFHDGTVFDAAAVKANLDLRKALPTFPFKAQVEPIKEVRVVDPRTVQFLLTQPSASLQVVLSATAFGMQSPTAMAKYPDRAEYAKNAAGTGPFKLESATATEFRFVRNEDYWGQKAYLDRLELKVITDPGAQLAALEAGDVNVVHNVVASERARLAGNPKLSVYPTAFAEQPWVLFFNLAKGFTAEKKVRQAIVQGLNTASYLGLAAGLGDVADSVVPPSSLGYAKQTPYPYDQAKARQMLTEAGVRPGAAVEILVLPTGVYAVPTAQLVKQDLDRLGFVTTIRQMDSPAWTAAMSVAAADSTWQLSIQGPAAQYPDAEYTLSTFLGANDAPKGLNYVHYKNPAFDALMVQQAAALDPAARGKLLAQAQQIVWDDLPVAPLMFTRRLIATSKSLRDFESLGSGRNRFDRAWLAP